jgi:NAD(P)H-dependent FMN reductase
MAHNGYATDDEGERVLPVPGILAMADCSEPNSENQALVDLAVGCVAATGTDVTILDLRDLELPEYADVSDPSELPQGAHAFRQLLCAHDGFLVALPSEPGEEPPLLLNAIAWSVCPAFGAEATVAYTGKCASLMSATGESALLNSLLAAVREQLTRLGVLVLPDALVISASDAAVTVDPARAAEVTTRLELQMRNLVGTIRWAQGNAPVDA